MQNNHNQYHPPQGPPPGYQQQKYAPPDGPPPGHQQRSDYAPPSGPPPSRQQPQQYAPPLGPPPSHQQHQEYAPPSGPPPSHGNYAPPSGPPPGRGDYTPPSGPPPGRGDFAPPPGPPPSHGSYAPPSGPPPARGDYAPPSGPPPGRGDFAPPSGPPPSHGDYVPPAGSPPSYGNYAPPAGQPPGYTSQQQPDGGPSKGKEVKHNWEAYSQDNSDLPPPPSFFNGWDDSPANNATEDEASAGEKWCKQNPLTPLMDLDGPTANARRAFNVNLIAPSSWKRRANQCERTGHGVFHIQTKNRSPDGSLFSYPPLYVVKSDQGSPKTIYYEVKFSRNSNSSKQSEEVSVSLGFSALPYPAFRLPGWHRGSLACHGDDGRRYINDRWGGKSFNNDVPFKKGQTVGIGMTFTPGSSRTNVNVFLTKDGRKFGGWDLHEETDAKTDLPVTGLEGYHDLAATIGTFDETDFQVFFHPSQWMYEEAKKACAP